MYKDNIQIRREGDLSTFHKVNLLWLWFFNTVGYHRRLILACFTDNSTFGSQILDISCCDNCLYNLYKGVNIGDDSGVPDWQLHNIIMRYSLYYLKTNKWHKYQEHIAIVKEINICTAGFELKKSEKAYGHNSTGQASTAVERVAIVKQKTADYKKVCKKALDTFAINIWPNRIDNIIFPYKQRAQLAKCGFFMKSSIDFVKALKADCNLTAPSIQEKIPLILGVILLTIENEDRQREIDIYQNPVSIGGENKDTPQQNNLRRYKRKQDSKDEVSHVARLEKICIQATKVVMKRIKTAAEKAESHKIKKAATTQDNIKRTFIKKKDKRISKKEKLNETPNIGMATQGDES